MDLLETKYQLKYYFQINPDDIVECIMADPEFKNYNNTELLLSIFDHIFCASQIYTNFIFDYNGPLLNSFFGENHSKTSAPKDYPCNQAQHLLEILKTNCLIFGLYNLLPSDPDKDFIKISSKKSSAGIDLGYFYTEAFSNKETSENGSAQYYNSRYGKFNKNKKESFSFYVLDSLRDKSDSEENNSKENSTKISVPKPIATLCKHLLTSTDFNTFNKQLHKNKCFLNGYQTLWQYFSDKYFELECIGDKLLLESQVNILLGMDFFNRLPELLDNIESSPNYTSGLTLYELKGAPISMYINQAANLPLYFGRYDFLQYACDAFRFSEDFQCLHLDNNITYPYKIANPQPTEKSARIHQGYALMTKYFDILGFITIPILYSLFVTVVDSLNAKLECGCKINEETYIEVLEKRYTSLKYEASEIKEKHSEIQDGIKKYCSFHIFDSYRKFYLYPQLNEYSAFTPLDLTIQLSNNLPDSNSKTEEEKFWEEEKETYRKRNLQMIHLESLKKHRNLIYDQLHEKEISHIINNS